MGRKRDRCRQGEQGTSRGYKHKVFLLEVSSEGREASVTNKIIRVVSILQTSTPYQVKGMALIVLWVDIKYR